MGYELMGRLHAALTRMRGESGQGTIEYVGLMLLMAVILAGVVKAAGGFTDDQGVAKAVIEKLEDAIKGVGGD